MSLSSLVNGPHRSPPPPPPAPLTFGRSPPSMPMSLSRDRDRDRDREEEERRYLIEQDRLAYERNAEIRYHRVLEQERAMREREFYNEQQALQERRAYPAGEWPVEAPQSRHYGSSSRSPQRSNGAVYADKGKGRAFDSYENERAYAGERERRYDDDPRPLHVSSSGEHRQMLMISALRFTMTNTMTTAMTVESR